MTSDKNKPMPIEMQKLRDELSESGSQNRPYQPYNSESFRTGWDCCFTAMTETKPVEAKSPAWGQGNIEKRADDFARSFRGFDDFEENLKALKGHFIFHTVLATQNRETGPETTDSQNVSQKIQSSDTDQCICGEINARNCPVHQEQSQSAEFDVEAVRAAAFNTWPECPEEIGPAYVGGFEAGARWQWEQTKSREVELHRGIWATDQKAKILIEIIRGLYKSVTENCYDATDVGAIQSADAELAKLGVKL